MKMKEEDGGIFCDIFGATPRNRILEHLLALRNLDFTIGDIARDTQLNRATTYNVMEELIEEKVVVPTRKVSGSQLYKLNSEKKEVKYLLNAFDLLLKKFVGSYKQENKRLDEPIMITN